VTSGEGEGKGNRLHPARIGDSSGLGASQGVMEEVYHYPRWCGSLGSRSQESVLEACTAGFNPGLKIIYCCHQIIL